MEIQPPISTILSPRHARLHSPTGEISNVLKLHNTILLRILTTQQNSGTCTMERTNTVLCHVHPNETEFCSEWGGIRVILDRILREGRMRITLSGNTQTEQNSAVAGKTWRDRLFLSSHEQETSKFSRAFWMRNIYSMSYTVTSIRITSTFFVVVAAPRSEASLSVILHSKKIGDVIQFLNDPSSWL